MRTQGSSASATAYTRRIRALVLLVLLVACTPRATVTPATSASLRHAADWDRARALVDAALVRATGHARVALLVERAAIAREVATYRRRDGYAAARAALTEAARELAGAPEDVRAAFLEEDGRVRYLTALERGEPLGDARAVFVTLRDLRARLGDPVALAWAWFHLGVAYEDDDLRDDARAAYERALPLAERDPVALGYVLRHLGQLAAPADALPLFERSLALRTRAGPRYAVVAAQLRVARAIADTDRRRAVQLAEDAVALASALRLPKPLAQAAELLAVLDPPRACAHRMRASLAWADYGDTAAAAAARCR